MMELSELALTQYWYVVVCVGAAVLFGCYGLFLLLRVIWPKSGARFSKAHRTGWLPKPRQLEPGKTGLCSAPRF
jgi:hypothetical protein